MIGIVVLKYSYFQKENSYVLIDVWIVRLLGKLKYEHERREDIQRHRHSHREQISINLFDRLNLVLNKRNIGNEKSIYYEHHQYYFKKIYPNSRNLWKSRRCQSSVICIGGSFELMNLKKIDPAIETILWWKVLM